MVQLLKGMRKSKDLIHGLEKNKKLSFLYMGGSKRRKKKSNLTEISLGPRNHNRSKKKREGG